MIQRQTLDRGSFERHRPYLWPRPGTVCGEVPPDQRCPTREAGQQAVNTQPHTFMYVTTGQGRPGILRWPVETLESLPAHPDTLTVQVT
jgi:hypothetical protein